MDNAGFRARRRAEHQDRESRKAGKLGGVAATTPLSEDGGNAYSNEPKVPARRMSPHLDVMCGPMLRYDTVTLADNVYHAFCLIAISDAGSDLTTLPQLTLEWDHATSSALPDVEHLSLNGEQSQDAANSRKVTAIKLYTYDAGEGKTSTFWRFKIEIPMAQHEEHVFYSVNAGPESSFVVPAIGQNFRWAGHSCNGFSGGVDTAAFNGPDPVWHDLLRQHEEKPIHVLIGGGDQLYCDPILREPELGPWMGEEDQVKKNSMPCTPEIFQAIDRFYFNHYCSWFRSGAFGQAISRLPMVNQKDDHDAVDGEGSYGNEVQSSPIFSGIAARASIWFLLFQCFISDDVDGVDQATHSNKSLILGGPAVWYKGISHSFMPYLGPSVSMLLLDTRTERKQVDQIVSPATYDAVFKAVGNLPPAVQHLVVLLGVPIAWPRMTAIETVLESKFNPVTLLAKGFGGGGFLNKFNKEPELLDDLNDHWCASGHKKERNWFIEQCQRLALDHRLRVTFLSGDVHCAGVAKFHSTKSVPAAEDPKHMLQIVSSAIVNTPPPIAVIHMTALLGKKTHKTLHKIHTDETLIPFFELDTDDSKLSHPSIMNRRNYVLVEIKGDKSELEFDIRVEKVQGGGVTKGYAVSTPAPGWQ